MRKLFASLVFTLWSTFALAQAITPVQMRDANLTTTNLQNFITTLNTFSAPRTLTIPGRGALNSYFIQFTDTANAVSPTNTLTIQPADGSTINGSASFVLSAPGAYVFLTPAASGYTANVVYGSGGAGPAAGGTNGQVQYNNSGSLGGFTVGGDGTLNTGTGSLTVTKTNGTALTALATTVPGTGVATALTTAVGSAGAFVTNGGALGTPSSGVGTNLTSLNATNLSSGTVAAARMPALTGDCTSTVGTVATTCTKTNGTNFTGYATAATGQLPGTATNDNATAGNIGEYASSIVLSGAAVALTTATAKDITTLALTAGDWDLQGVCATNPTGSTTTSVFICNVTTTANTLNNAPSDGGAFAFNNSAQPAGGGQAITTDTARVSITATTTYHLVAQASFAVSTLGAYGKLRARRVR